MALKPGTLLGPHEILSLIGAGGMGEVYKARDTRLNRIVAIKTLPAHLAERPELRERFKREASTLANLKHAHICTLYDIGHQEIAAEDFDGSGVAPRLAGAAEPAGLRRTVGIDYLVMEYLEGETLAERLKKGPLPLEQVWRYAIELADALDKAHRANFTHRDIKPGNIMLTKEGSKLLDFGLAKLKQEIVNASVPPSERPTAPGTLTQHGTLLGTLQYMAPEQVEGKTDELDGRTDVFAFGAVVYEMATGKKAFDGKNQASVIAKILEIDPPPMSSLQPPGKMSPPALDRVVKRCLAKDREERWQTAYDLWQDLEWIKEAGQAGMPALPTARSRLLRRWALGAGLAAIIGAVIAGLAVWNLKPAPAKTTERVVIALSPGERLAALDQQAVAISPDGKNIVYVANRGGVQQLYLRSLDSFESRPIPGTEGANSPFFSPDGQWLGFVTLGKLQKVSISGGTPVTISNFVGAPFQYGATWGTDDMIVLQSTALGPLARVPAAGGTPQPLTGIGFKKGEISHRWPEFLPGAKAVLFASSAALGNWNSPQLGLYVLKTGERRDLPQGGTRPRYAASGQQGGHLLYAQGGTLMAMPFDLGRLEVRGSPVPVAEGILQSVNTGAAQYSFSDNGALVYIPGGIQSAQRTMVWVDRKGTEQPLAAPAHAYRGPRISPDGRRVAVGIEELGSQVWLYDLARDTLTRLTFEGSGSNNPVWTPDGKRVAFQAGTIGNLFWQPADGSGKAERLSTSERNQVLGSWSPDGQAVVFYENDPTTNRDLWVWRLSDPSAGSLRLGSGQAGQVHKAQVFLRTPFNEAVPAFSPDGHWLAYVSDESGRNEVYVQPYPGPGGKWQISTEGGGEPVWNRNGREMFYRSGNKMMAVDVNQSRDSNGAGPSGFSAGKPKMLFEGPYLAPALIPNYDVSPDGQRFLMVKASGQEQTPTQINVVLNWFEELRRKAPVK